MHGIVIIYRKWLVPVIWTHFNSLDTIKQTDYYYLFSITTQVQFHFIWYIKTTAPVYMYEFQFELHTILSKVRHSFNMKSILQTNHLISVNLSKQGLSSHNTM